MQLDDLRGRQSMDSAHLSQIRTELSAIAHRDFHPPRPRQFYPFKPLEIPPENRFHFVVSQPQSIKLDQQRAVRRMKIADACNGLQLEQPQQLLDLLMGLECNLLTEVNQQRLHSRPINRSRSCCGCSSWSPK